MYLTSETTVFLPEETAFRISKMFMTMIEEKYLLNKPIKMLLSW